MIKLENIEKNFISGKETINVLNNISLDIFNEDNIAILGKSGSGKSTLLNIIGLSLKPTNGNLFLNEMEIDDKTSIKKLAELRNEMFGYIVQDFALINDDTVLENVEIPLIYSKNKIKKKDRINMVKEVLEMVDLSRISLKEKVRNLSGGERQRVSIARAIINNPKVILADEPTGSLDFETGNQILNLLFEITSKDKVLLMVTHDNEIANKFKRKVKIINGLIEEF